MGILVVEDNPVTGLALVEILKDRGRRASWAANGEAALIKLGVESYAGMVLDHYLTGMSGLEVLRSVRDQELTANMPVVVVTAAVGEQADAIRRAVALVPGPNAVLMKPFEVEELLAAVEALRVKP